MSHMGRRPAVDGRPEGQAKVDMEEGTEEGGGQVEVPGTGDDGLPILIPIYA